MAKVSKNAKIAQRAANAGTGKDFVKIVKSIKDPVTGKYTYKEVMIHKDEMQNFLGDQK
ncbi:MAG TPA: DUF4295 domain-containing protein [Saprospirales bacterium]|nr:DUF4295 domain-containing protein [Saprospirales bacterium]HRQ29824.1 DUF4295 family protein [Saprospiraceae bacterium]